MKEFDFSEENIKRTINGDFFGRNSYIKQLINYVWNAEEQTSFAINGEWGSGKTVFMHQFMVMANDEELYKQLNIEGYRTSDLEIFYYNAWENELLNRPSISLLNSIISEYRIIDEADKDAAKELVQKLANIAIKIGTAGILNVNDFKIDGSNEIDIDSIRETFKQTIEHIQKKKQCKRVVIIIDELDRCKPTNVIRFLEEIKHFYNHDDLSFIFSADLKQLSCTIKSLYGTQFDSDLYLQRFFDAVFTLNSSCYEKYITEELAFNISQTQILNETCKIAISNCGLSVRETNKFIKKIKTIRNQIDKLDSFDRKLSIARVVFVPWGIALKYRDMSQYESFIHGEITIDEIRKYISNSKGLLDWLSEYYNQNRNVSDNFDICVVLENIYHLIFKKKDFRYYGDDYENMNYRNIVLPLIEF